MVVLGRRINLATLGPLALAASRILIQACGLLVLIYAARTLRQDEMGMFALMSSAVLLATKVSEAGWAELATASSPGKLPDANIFWCAVAASGTMTLAYILIGVVGDIFWEMPFHGWAIYFAMICTVMPTAMASTQYGVLIRDGRLSTLAGIQAVAEIAGTTVCIYSLMHGQGNLSLAYSRVTVAAFTVGGAFLAVRWIPYPAFSRADWRDNYRYSMVLVAARVVSFVNSYGAEFLIGAFLGLREVGIYRVASRIAGAVAEVCFEPLRVIGWNAIAAASNLDQRRRKISIALELLLGFAFFVCMPIFVGLYFVASDLVDLVLERADWREAAPIIAVLALSKLCGIVSLFSESSLSVIEKGKLIPRIALLSMCVTTAFTAMGGYFYATPVAIAWFQLGAGLFMTSFLGWLLYVNVGWSPVVVLKELRQPLAAVGVMSASIYAVTRLMQPGTTLMRLIAEVLIAAATYLIASGREPWRQLGEILAFRKRVAEPPA